MANNSTAPAFDPTSAYTPAFNPNAGYAPADQSQTSTPPPAEGILSKIGDVGSDLAVGATKGLGDTVSGISHLVNKIPVVGETLAPSSGISALDQMDQSQNTTQSVGKGIEGIAEFAAGDEMLDGLAKASKIVALGQKYPLVQRVLTLAADHPFLAKIITEGTKGAAVGAGQGAVKGSQQDNAVEGALAGGAGGAVGGTLGGAVEAAAAPADPIKALTQAVRPTGKLATNFAEKAQLALPELITEHATTPITTLDDLSDAAHNAAQRVWDKIATQIKNYANEIIPGKPVADAIRTGMLPGDADLFPESVDAADTFAKKFDSDMTLQQASDRLQSLNRKLSSLYRLDPASRYAATANTPTVEAMESGANELRAQIYKKLESLGEPDPAGLRKTYGALNTVEQTAEKRAAVVGRAAPLNLSQQLSTAAAAMGAAGHLVSGNVPAAVASTAPMIAAGATKVLNSPEHLIGNALEPNSGAIAQLARKASRPAAAVGSTVGQVLADIDNKDEQ